MRIQSAEMYALSIPFRIDFAHSQARRLASDSLILNIRSGAHSGFGEAVVRDYVSGSIGKGDLLTHAAKAAGKMLSELMSTELDLSTVKKWCLSADPPARELPILCAVETAVLDLLCRTEETLSLIHI